MTLLRAVSFAFKRLREQGFTTSAAKFDCASCAGAVLDGKEPIAYYTTQDRDDAHVFGMLYIGFSPPRASVGRSVVRVFEQEGIETEWNGNGHTKIRVRGKLRLDKQPL